MSGLSCEAWKAILPVPMASLIATHSIGVEIASKSLWNSSHLLFWSCSYLPNSRIYSQSVLDSSFCWPDMCLSLWAREPGTLSDGPAQQSQSACQRQAWWLLQHLDLTSANCASGRVPVVLLRHAETFGIAYPLWEQADMSWWFCTLQ